MTGLDYVSLGLILIAVLIITLGIIKVHTYPGVVARERNHPQVDAIEVTSLLGLIMFPLWMGALVWAYSGAVFGNLYEQQTPTAENDNDTDAEADAPTETDDPGESDNPGETDDPAADDKA
jgi:hypothetical protein